MSEEYWTELRKKIEEGSAVSSQALEYIRMLEDIIIGLEEALDECKED